MTAVAVGPALGRSGGGPVKRLAHVVEKQVDASAR